MTEQRREGDVCCRNLALMYHYFLNVLGWPKERVDELFIHLLPAGLSLAEALDPENWIEHRVYDDIVRNLVLTNLKNRQLLFDMGSCSSKCEPLGDMIRKLRMLVFEMGLSVRGVYEKLIPSVVPWFNKTKEFLPMEMSETGCVYMVRMFQLVDPLNDWMSDWWIRGILSEPTTIFKLRPAVVKPRVLPFDIVRLLAEEFSELNLKVEIRGNELFVNGEVCGRRVYLQEDKVSNTDVQYFSGKYTEEAPEGDCFEGMLITRVLPAMKNAEQGWQAATVGEVYISYEEFDRHHVKPYFILDIQWGKIPWFLRGLFRVLSLFSLFRIFRKSHRSDLQELNQTISRMSERMANLDLALEDRTVALRSANDQLNQAVQVIQQQNAQLQTLTERLRKVLYKSFPSKTIADIIIDQGYLPAQKLLMSVLYVDIVGSTPATEALGPVKWMEVVTRFYTEVERIVEGMYGGAYQYIGDELVGLWSQELTATQEIGVADQAVKAALSILHALKDFEYPVRIGVATGAIVIGTVETPKRLTVCCFGSKMNEGARHERQAEPGQFVFEQATYDNLSQAIRDLYCRPGQMEVRRDVQLKGVSTPSTLYVFSAAKDAEG